jgi:hypothetical protein
MVAELSSTLIVDPDQVEGVVQSVPLDTLPIRLLDGYSSEKLVRCQFCRQRQKHYRGFFVELNTGAKALAGNCCATRIGGQERVAEIKREVTRKEKYADSLREKHILYDRLSLMLSGIEEKWLPAEEAVSAAISEIYQFMWISEIPRFNTFSNLVGRLKGALEKCQGEYYKHRERIISDLDISVQVARRGPKELVF